MKSPDHERHARADRGIQSYSIQRFERTTQCFPRVLHLTAQLFLVPLKMILCLMNANESTPACNVPRSPAVCYNIWCRYCSSSCAAQRPECSELKIGRVQQQYKLSLAQRLVESVCSKSFAALFRLGSFPRIANLLIAHIHSEAQPSYNWRHPAHCPRCPASNSSPASCSLAPVLLAGSSAPAHSSASEMFCQH